MTGQQTSLYAYSGKNFAVIRGFYTVMRFALTSLYFGILIPMLNELVLCIVSWFKAGEVPSLTDFVTAAFMTAWSPIAFGAPALAAGLVFALLVTVFRHRTVACLVTPVVCVALTVFYLGQYVHVENNMTYHLSATMQRISAIDAALFGLLLSVLASTVLKSFLMPFRQAKPVLIKSEIERAATKSASPSALVSRLKAPSVRFEPV
ncbi:MAG: hypothetical protein ACRCWR_04655, partial [Saezia sp.]